MQHYAATNGRGIDISQVRLDDLDKKIIRFATKWKGRKIAVDFGCGKGRVSIILALMGFEVFLYDLENHTKHFQDIAQILNLEDKIHFTQIDLKDLKEEDLPNEITIVIAQRTLHHLHFSDAQNVLKISTQNMQNKAQLYISLTGIDSQIADGYECKHEPLETRFCKTGEVGQEIFHITSAVCLYSKADIELLFSDILLHKSELYTSTFKNIKAVYTK